MGNRDRIIIAAKELFNLHGSSNVGTNKIAAHLGISPGNLYYHFKNREEIIRTIFPEISSATDAALTVPNGAPLSPNDIGDIMVNWIQLVWKYRFFYGNLVALLRKDALLKELYTDRRVKTLSMMQAAFFTYSQHKMADAADFSEDDAGKLAKNVWIVALNWIGFLQVEKEDQDITFTDLLAGAHQIFALMEPYLDQPTIIAIQSRIQSRLNAAT
ncbi:MAG: TetR/AcrR family transcriptional regulator [Sneathiella sp.]